MKKLIILSLGAMMATSALAIAQDNPSRSAGTVNKKGIAILPEAGDFTIGVDASPILEYFGGLLSRRGSDAPTFNINHGTLQGRYFLTDRTAIRANLRMRFSNDENAYTVADDYRRHISPLNTFATTVDYVNYKTNVIDLSLGYEMRRGYGRLQGVWGGEVMLGMSNNSTEYTYGNEMTSLNQTPTTYLGNANNRQLSTKGGTQFRFGVGGFAGVEYFIAPKISLGAELGLQFFTSTPSRFAEQTFEFYNSGTQTVETHTNRINQNNHRSVGIETITSGNFFMKFNF